MPSCSWWAPSQALRRYADAASVTNWTASLTRSIIDHTPTPLDQEAEICNCRSKSDRLSKRTPGQQIVHGVLLCMPGRFSRTSPTINRQGCGKKSITFSCRPSRDYTYVSILSNNEEYKAQRIT